MSGFNLTAGASIDLSAATERAAHLAVEHVLQVARTRVPHDEGTLERSGSATVEMNGTSARGAVSFDTPYAARQHEDMTARHGDGRQAKYLESALTGESAVVARLVQRELRKALEG